MNTDQALLLIDRWQRARKRKLENGRNEVRIVEKKLAENAPEVKVAHDSQHRVHEKTQEEIILHSYLSGASEARIAKIGKIPIETVREVIAKGNV